MTVAKLRLNLATYRWLWAMAGLAFALLLAAGLIEGRRAEAAA